MAEIHEALGRAKARQEDLAAAPAALTLIGGSTTAIVTRTPVKPSMCNNRSGQPATVG